MPEYLAPGVYVEETSYRAKSIEGVGTSTAAFVGPARFGPVTGEPELLTSYADFERTYAGLDALNYSGSEMINYVAHAVRAFFEEGGRRLYFARIYENETAAAGKPDDVAIGCSFGKIDDDVVLQARHPGAAGNVGLTFAFRLEESMLQMEPGKTSLVLRGACDHAVVWVREKLAEGAPASEGTLYWLKSEEDGYHFYDAADTDQTLDELVTAVAGGPVTDEKNLPDVRILKVDVTMGRMGKLSRPSLWSGLSLHPAHAQSLSRTFAPDADASRATQLYVPLVMRTALTNGAAIGGLLLEQNSQAKDSGGTYLTIGQALADKSVSPADCWFQVVLKNGSDGDRPSASAYQGSDAVEAKSGLAALEDLEDVAIVAAPGSTYGGATTYEQDAIQANAYLISHAEKMRYRIAVLDSVDGHILSDVKGYRARFDSSHAALYYPWIKVLDPITRQEIILPPSGFVTGIYARSDVAYGVHKAPANEPVRSAIGLEISINRGQQEVLNPLGINCIRFFEGKGQVVWGARTMSSDPEWKYVNLRRYFAYLEHSIDRGTGWAVFMNNDEPLWANVRQTISDFLYNELRSARLMGAKPEEAYFVRCDRTTMTQNDIDNGRLICLVGVSALRPAEFVIFRIGQWTATKS